MAADGDSDPAMVANGDGAGVRGADRRHRALSVAGRRRSSRTMPVKPMFDLAASDDVRAGAPC